MKKKKRIEKKENKTEQEKNKLILLKKQHKLIKETVNKTKNYIKNYWFICKSIVYSADITGNLIIQQ